MNEHGKQSKQMQVVRWQGESKWTRMISLFLETVAGNIKSVRLEPGRIVIEVE